MNKTKSYEQYCLDFPEETQIILENVKNFIQNFFPESDLCINYGIPTFKINGKNAVHFGAFKNHVGFYPGSEAIEVFAENLQNYKTSKGAVQFPIRKEIPWELVKKIVEFRLEKLTSD